VNPKKGAFYDINIKRGGDRVSAGRHWMMATESNVLMVIERGIEA